MGESWKPDKHTWLFTPEFEDGELVFEGFLDAEEIEFEPDEESEWVWEYN